MKKLFSLALVALLLLNITGGYWIFVGMQFRNEVIMQQGLDAGEYETAQAITIKVPLAVPYASPYSDFQRVDGKFEHRGELYRLIKQKLSHDTLTVVCIKDQENKRINEALTDYVKTFTDSPADSKPGSKTVFSFFKEYLSEYIILNKLASGWDIDVIRPEIPVAGLLLFPTSIVHPPERG